MFVLLCGNILKFVLEGILISILVKPFYAFIFIMSPLDLFCHFSLTLKGSQSLF